LALETDILVKTLPVSAFETSKLPSAAARAAASSILVHNRCYQSNNVSPFFTKSLSLIYTLLTYPTLGIIGFMFFSTHASSVPS
jgi:hypothetical protein